MCLQYVLFRPPVFSVSSIHALRNCSLSATANRSRSNCLSRSFSANFLSSNFQVIRCFLIILLHLEASFPFLLFHFQASFPFLLLQLKTRVLIFLFQLKTRFPFRFLQFKSSFSISLFQSKFFLFQFHPSSPVIILFSRLHFNSEFGLLRAHFSRL